MSRLDSVELRLYLRSQRCPCVCSCSEPYGSSILVNGVIRRIDHEFSRRVVAPIICYHLFSLPCHAAIQRVPVTRPLLQRSEGAPVLCNLNNNRASASLDIADV